MKNLFRPLFVLPDWMWWETVSETKARHKELLNAINLMAKTAQELADEIRASTAQTRKATDEILGKIKNLEDIIAAGGDLSAIEAAVAELKTSTQTLDDVVPDVAPEPEPPAA